MIGCGHRDDAGTTLVEILIGTAITLVVTAAALGLLIEVRAGYDGRTGAADLDQRVRAAVATLERDVVGAGAGRTVGQRAGSLLRFLPPVVPYRRGSPANDPEGPGDVLGLLFAPPGGAEADVRGVSIAGTLLIVDAEPNCGAAWPDRVCGFAVGARAAVVAASGSVALGTVMQTDGARIVLDAPGAPAVGLDTGAVLLEIAAPTYALGTDPETGAPRLMRHDGFRTNRSVVDHVVAFEVELFADPEPPHTLRDEGSPELDPAIRTTYGPAPPPLDVDDGVDSWAPGENCLFARVDGRVVPRLVRLATGDGLVPLTRPQWTDGPWCADLAPGSRYDADLLRVRRVRIGLRLEASADALRGAAGWWFARGGRSTSASRFVPDRYVRLDVSPRNLNLGR